MKKSYYKYWMTVPCMAIWLVFFLLPVLLGIGFSFINIQGLDFSTVRFVGIQHYIDVLTTASMSIAIKNSLIFALLTSVLKVGLGMLLAIFLNSKMKTSNIMRTVFFLPAVMSSVAVGVIFKAMMHPSQGTINNLLRLAGLEALCQNWLTDPKIAIFSISFVEVWRWTGFTMVILLAGLQSIDQSYYEATELDGASAWQKFRYVTFPLVMPAFTNAVVINLIGGLKAFDIVQTLTAGGPGKATEVFGTLIYRSFGGGRYGEGCAASIILSILLLIIVFPLYKFLTGKEVEM